MRGKVIKEVEDFKEKEHGLTGNEWRDINFATTADVSDPSVTYHVSEVDYKSLSDDDLMRFLLYLHRSWDSVIDKRIRHDLLGNLAEKLGLDGEIVSLEFRGKETIIHPYMSDELKAELDDINDSLDNYFEGDNDQFFSEEYYEDLKARRDEIMNTFN